MKQFIFAVLCRLGFHTWFWDEGDMSVGIWDGFFCERCGVYAEGELEEHLYAKKTKFEERW